MEGVDELSVVDESVNEEDATEGVYEEAELTETSWGIRVGVGVVDWLICTSNVC
jgi:hypothetical protein